MAYQTSSVFLVTILFGFLLCFASITASNDLFNAVFSDDKLLIRKALEHNRSNLNQKGPGGQTPLMNAVLSGKLNAVEVLLSEGADISIGEKDGYTPMHGAGFQGRSDIARLLIDHGVDSSDYHSDGFAPIHRACWGRERRHTDTVKVFLEAGVDPDMKATSGHTCVEMSKNKGTLKLLKDWKSGVTGHDL